MALTRRFFLIGSVGAAGLAAAGLYAARSLLGPEQTVASFVRTSIPGLNMPEDALEAFARDAIAYKRLDSRRLHQMLFLMANPPAKLVLPDTVRLGQDRHERAIITQFMKGTDFLEGDRGEEPVSYLGFADPYEWGCANNLATFERWT